MQRAARSTHSATTSSLQPVSGGGGEGAEDRGYTSVSVSSNASGSS